MKRMEWISGLPETPCGLGSTLTATASVRAALPELMRKYEIVSVVDAGAGDLNWVSHLKWEVDYRPFDLIPRHPAVRQADITRDRLPSCDLILCRHVLNHLDEWQVRDALRLFQQAGQYLLANQFDQRPPGREFEGWNSYDLRLWLGDPLERIPDTEHTGDLALWKL